FDELGLDLSYEAVQVAPTALPRMFPELRRRCIGLNVTAPLKEAVMRFLDDIDPLAATVRSVNTVRFENGAAYGTSTDGVGFLAALAAAGIQRVASAVIL